jgi:uncharacterized protein (TIGR02646 family)
MELRVAFGEWSGRDLDGSDRARIREELREDFGAICAYCEKTCHSRAGSKESPDGETIDHFRPRSLFPGLWLDWLNLVYVCWRCNDIKGDSWPGYGNSITEKLLPATEYVNPNAASGRRAANEFFDFNVENGEIRPSEGLNSEEQFQALRTIRDIDLNDLLLSGNDPDHLLIQRLDWLDAVLERLEAVDDFNRRVTMLFEFALPNQPFSGFIYAYIMDRFPILAQLFHRR